MHALEKDDLDFGGQSRKQKDKLANQHYHPKKMDILITQGSQVGTITGKISNGWVDGTFSNAKFYDPFG